ncbi:hypothetical protein N658DRAFT_306743 [Parathielavia hyrcaniae]|uniref:F-box domain-containing protein n=1 Tax=Parathielavia hyrcaniae TaxID=113614 RepID=A0AAN6Q496_9PEZI|nr:hypothetical protein N658DRAFT_306743 [Parathielavia hyrcaniae]
MLHFDSCSAVPATPGSRSSPPPSPSSPPINSLPVELLLAIATTGHHFLTAASLNALAQTCRSFHELLNPLLYRLNVEAMGASAAMHAAKHGHVAVLERLAAHGADFAAVKDEDGWEYGPVGVAACRGHHAVLSWFLSRTRVAEAPLVLHGALVGAVFGGHVCACRVLREHGVELCGVARLRKALVATDSLQRARADVIWALAEGLMEEEVGC